MHPLLIVLISILGLLMLLLFLLLFGSARLHVTYTTKKPRVQLSVLGIRIKSISPPEPEEAAHKDLSGCRNPKRVLRRELKRQKKLAAKAEKQRQKAAQKAALKAKRKKERKALAAKQPSPSISENLGMILDFLKHLYDITNGKMHVRVKRLRISVATGDAATTAILYGSVIGVAAAIIEFIEERFFRIHRDPGDMQIRADYLASKPSAEVDIVCSIRLYRLLSIGVSSLLAWKNGRAAVMQSARDRVANTSADKA